MKIISRTKLALRVNGKEISINASVDLWKTVYFPKKNSPLWRILWSSP